VRPEDSVVVRLLQREIPDAVNPSEAAKVDQHISFDGSYSPFV
jgi:hypothetical protein